MVGQDLRERVFVLGLHQRFDGTRGQLGECLVGGANTVNGPGLFSVSTSPPL